MSAFADECEQIQYAVDEEGCLHGHPPVFNREKGGWGVYGVPMSKCYSTEALAKAALAQTREAEG